MNLKDLEYLNEVGKKLLPIVRDCRATMHEPDEQTVSARVIGTYFDNAAGDWLDIEALLGGYQEIVVVLDRVEPQRFHLTFNLADLIALARVGAVTVNQQLFKARP